MKKNQSERMKRITFSKNAWEDCLSWATEVGNPRYILDLLLSIINVGMQTVQIVKGLPEVRFE